MLNSAGLGNFTTEVINSTEPVLVEFFSPSCVPCKQIKPTLELVASQGHKVVTVNVEDEPELTNHFGVGAVPTMVWFKQGKAGPRVVGLKSHLQLVELLET